MAKFKLSVEPSGVAPDAQLFDVKVFDVEGADTTQGEVPLTSAGMVAAISSVYLAPDVAAAVREFSDLFASEDRG